VLDLFVVSRSQSKPIDPFDLFTHQPGQMYDIRKSIVDQFIGPDAVPLAVKLGTL